MNCAQVTICDTTITSGPVAQACRGKIVVLTVDG
jgi:hypothetical protein